MGSTADTLFVNGRVFTAPATEPVTAGVAVRGGRIAAVGPDDELREPSARRPRLSTSTAGC